MLISGHDVTVMPMLASLGDDVWDGKWIPYASMFLIEVRNLKLMCFTKICAVFVILFVDCRANKRL